MDPKFRSSFIPKKPLSTRTEGNRPRKKSSVDLVMLVASILFLAAIAGSAGVFLYKLNLENIISNKGLELTEASNLLASSEIEEYKLFDERLKTAWKLLRDHKITSEFFPMLDENTLHNIQFDKYEFKENLEITLLGKAASFNALALQADVFERQKLIESIDYNDFEILEDGTLSFRIVATLNAEEITFLTQ